jgi:hypothetical protein
MDLNRFDTLTRALHDARARRGALTTLLGGTPTHPDATPTHHLSGQPTALP